MKSKVIFMLTVILLPLAGYAVCLLALKGPVNPWVEEPSVFPTTELIIPSDIRFVDTITLEAVPPQRESQKAALLVDSRGRTALLPQRLDALPGLPQPQRLAISVLTQWQTDATPKDGRVVESTIRRFKNMKTGELKDFSNQYPSSAEWVPVPQ